MFGKKTQLYPFASQVLSYKSLFFHFKKIYAGF